MDKYLILLIKIDKLVLKRKFYAIYTLQNFK